MILQQEIRILPLKTDVLPQLMIEPELPCFRSCATSSRRQKYTPVSMKNYSENK